MAVDRGHEVERGGCVIDTAALRLDLTMRTRVAALRKAGHGP